MNTEQLPVQESNGPSSKPGASKLVPTAVVVALACGVGLLLAAVDVLLLVTQAPKGWAEPGQAAAVLSATASVVTVLFLVVWFAALRPLARGDYQTQCRWLTALTLFAVSTFLLFCIKGVFPTLQYGMAALVVSLPLLFLSGGLGYVGYKRTRNFDRFGALLGLSALPLALIAVVVWYWFKAYDPGSMALWVLLAGMILLTHRLLRARNVRLTGAVLASFQMLFLLWGAVAVATHQPVIVNEAAGPAAASTDPRHVILLVVDTLRADALSVYNPAATPTPHLDALAQDSVVFDHAYSPAAWTVPAMTSIMTGLPLAAHQRNDPGPREQLPFRTLAEDLGSAGYYTGAILENPFLGPQFGFVHGFAEYLSFPQPTLGNGLGGELLRIWFPGRYREEADTAYLTETARQWVENHQQQPFFLWLHYFDPHVPYSPPQRFLEGQTPIDWIGTSFDYHKEVRGGAILTPEDRAWIRKLYLAEVQFVDEQVGAFLAGLKESGLYDDSLIVFLSDHGEEFWEHGGYEHGHAMYDEVIRVPLMFKLPHSEHKGRVDDTVSTVAVRPTVLDLTGVSINDDCYSFPSLTPYLRQSAPPEPFPIFSEGTIYFENQSAVVFDDHKLIRLLASATERLFDLASDPAEQHAEKSPAVEEKGRALLEQHQQRFSEVSACYGLSGDADTQLDAETLKRLRSLGYIK